MRSRLQMLLPGALQIGAMLLCLHVALSAKPPQEAAGVWIPRANMVAPRAGACAALLPGDRILITGGFGGTGVLDSAEIFANGSFSSAASMITARAGHTCVALQDGRVLVAGGSSEAGPIAQAEIYDPAVNRWLPSSDMATPRAGHTATLLADGRVLIAGGEAAGVVHNTVEVFDPASNEFLPPSTGTLSSPRKEHAASLLPDGRVLIAGGSDGSSALASSDLYDPITGTLAGGAVLLTPRAGLSATTLLDGRVLLAGGTDGKDDLATAEIYDPRAAKVTGVVRMTAARRGHVAFRLPHNNAVLLVGGNPENDSAELYVPWRELFQRTGSLPEARSEAAGTPMSRDGTLVVAGGKQNSIPLYSSRLYRFATLETDAERYSPGAVVTVTGTGWQPREQVTLVVEESPKVSAARTQPVAADSSGNIRSQIQLAGGDGGREYSITAIGARSQAMAPLSTNSAANLDQCADGAVGTPKTACVWVNGNVNGSKAQYLEGDSVGYRMLMTNIPAGSNTLTIEWDTTQSGKHALDYITSWNRTVFGNPCAGVTGCPSGSTTFPIPVDPNVTAAGVTPIPGQLFTLYGGTITGLSAYSLSGTYAGSSSTSITITFNATAGQPTLVLAWGGHIATRLDWGSTNSAVAISGSPFHTRLIALNGSGGNQDRALSNDAVVFPASITVVKSGDIVSPPGVFQYTASPSPLSNFSLTVDGTTSNIKTFSGITTFTTYTVAENTPLPAGWTFVSLSCLVGAGGTGGTPAPTISGQTATINLKEGDPVTCTYVNAVKKHTVTLIKSLSPTTDSGTFNLTVNSTTTPNPVGNGGQLQVTNVAVFSTVNVSESAANGNSLANYSTTLSCPGTNLPAGSTISGSFTMPDADVTCTVTNTRRSHTVTLTKILSPTTDTGKFDLTVNGNTTSNVGNGGQTPAVTVTGGSTVNVGEIANLASGTNLVNYTSVLSCPGTNLPAGSTTSGSFTMPDTDVTCTVTNTRKTHKVTLTKTLSPANDPGKFNLTAAGVTATDQVNGGSAQNTAVAVGSSVTVSEAAGTGTVLANYTSSLSCTGVTATGTTSANFTMPDNDVSCTVTNTRKTHTVTLTKSLVPSNDTGKFNLTAAGITATDQVNGGSAQNTAVAVGSSVTVSEAAGTGTVLANYTSSLSCTGVTATGTTSANFTMPDNDVSCTVTNTRKTHTVTLTKSLVPSNDTGKFNLTAAGVTATDQANGGSAQNTSVVVGSSVTVGEAAGTGTVLANYTSSLSCTGVTATGTTSANFTMPDNDVSCTVTNTRKTHTVTLTKSLVPSNDTGKFNLTAGSVTVTDQGNGGFAQDTAVRVGSSVNVGEAAGTGTSLTSYISSLNCVGVSATGTTGASFTMPDQDVSCTVTNNRRPTLTVTKVCAGTPDSSSFGVAIGPSGPNFSLGCGGSSTVQLNAGPYTVSEPGVPAGWNLPNATGGLPNGWNAPGQIVCDGVAGGNITLNNGDQKTCFILNVSSACIPIFPPTGTTSSQIQTQTPGRAVFSPVRPMQRR